MDLDQYKSIFKLFFTLINTYYVIIRHCLNILYWKAILMKLRALTLAICFGAAVFATNSASAKDYTKAEIEQIVHDYILNNPDVLMEAGDKVKERQAQQALDQQNKLIQSIYADKAIPSSGAKNGKHKIIEFFDYNCGYCKKARPILKEILNDNLDVQYYYMEFPILSEISVTAAEIGIALYAINPKIYEKYNDQLMTRNDRLQTEVQLQALVESLDPKIKWSEVKKISKTPQVQQTLNNIRGIAQKLNVNGTPAFIIDGEVLRGAPRSADMVKTLLK